MPKRTIFPISCSFTPRSMAGTRITVQSDFRQPVQGADLLWQNVRLAANDSVGLAFKAVELEIDVGAHLGKFGEKTLIRRDALAVRVEHHVCGCRGPALRGCNRMICGWMDGSPPENWTTSGCPSART